jgi:hypothetical protein
VSQLQTTDWSEVAANNSATPPNGAPEGGILIGQLSDWMREAMSALKIDWNRKGPTVTSGGSGNAQSLTYTTAPPAYARGLVFSFTAGGTNTGPATLNVNGLGARAIQLGGAALRGMEIVAGLTYTVMDDGTQFQLIAGCLGFTPNTLINGGFEIWQRGAGGSASIAVAASTTAYTADRWYITTGANQASVVSQQASLTSQSRSCGRFRRNSGQTGTGAMVAGQPYTTDMLVPIRGSRITISGWLASGANWSPTSGNITISFYVGTGAEGKRGGGFTSETTVVTTTIALAAGSGATFFSATSAAVVPTNVAQGELQITWTPTGTAGAADDFSIDDVKVEPNIGPTPFDRPLFADELTRCLRFYQKSFIYSTAPAQNAGTGAAHSGIAGKAGAAAQFLQLVLTGKLRTFSPTVTLFNPSAANGQIRDVSAGVDCSATGIFTAGDGFQVYTATGAAGTAVGNVLMAHWTADGDL